MASRTDNYSLLKLDLTDVPDITLINENWDNLDRELPLIKPLIVSALSSNGEITYTNFTPRDVFDAVDTGRECFLLLNYDHYLPLQFCSSTLVIFAKTSFSTNITVYVSENNQTITESVYSVASVNTAFVG